MSEKRDKLDEALSCSFCHERFRDFIKIIPCGKSICGRCYENLKVDADNQSNMYKCLGCSEEHTLPPSGLSDNEQLLQLLNNFPRKPLSGNAQKLEEKVREVEVKLKELESFDCSEFVRVNCEKIELEVSEAIGRAIEHLNEIEKKMMNTISKYRDRCLENICSGQETSVTKKEFAVLTKEFSEFNTRWSKYSRRIEAFETESDIEAALTQAGDYISKLESMDKRMRKEAINWEKIVFHEKTQFLKEWNHIGEFEIIVEPKPGINLEKLDVPVTNNSKTKIKRIKENGHSCFTLTGHSDSVLQVLFLPDGRLASCSADQTIKIWNVENGKELFQLKGHTDWVYSIALLPNGHLASGSGDNTIRIWDLKQKKEIRTIKAHSDYVLSLRVLKNGNLASYSCDDTIKIWNLNPKEDELVSTMRGHGNTNWSFRFFWILSLQLFGILSNDNLVTCSRHEKDKECILRVWNPKEPRPLKSVSVGFDYVSSLLVLSNDQVALGFLIGTIRIIDLRAKPVSRTKERVHDGWFYSLEQLSNGNLVSAGKDASKLTIKVWNLLDWRLLQTINTGHSDWTQSLSISGDERFLASGSNDTTIELWPIRTK